MNFSMATSPKNQQNSSSNPNEQKKVRFSFDSWKKTKDYDFSVDNERSSSTSKRKIRSDGRETDDSTQTQTVTEKSTKDNDVNRIDSIYESRKSSDEAELNFLVIKDTPDTQKKKSQSSQRHFHLNRKLSYPWIQYDAIRNLMTCNMCIKHKKDNPFTIGSNKFRKDYLAKHETYSDHTTALQDETQCKTLEKLFDDAIVKQDEKILKQMECGLAFDVFHDLCSLCFDRPYATENLISTIIIKSVLMTTLNQLITLLSEI